MCAYIHTHLYYIHKNNIFFNLHGDEQLQSEPGTFRPSAFGLNNIKTVLMACTDPCMQRLSVGTRTSCSDWARAPLKSLPAVQPLQTIGLAALPLFPPVGSHY